MKMQAGNYRFFEDFFVQAGKGNDKVKVGYKKSPG
jgi:hypothetical protein